MWLQRGLTESEGARGDAGALLWFPFVLLGSSEGEGEFLDRVTTAFGEARTVSAATEDIWRHTGTPAVTAMTPVGFGLFASLPCQAELRLQLKEGLCNWQRTISLPAVWRSAY
jgi:hypothetical protein